VNLEWPINSIHTVKKPDICLPENAKPSPPAGGA